MNAATQLLEDEYYDLILNNTRIDEILGEEEKTMSSLDQPRIKGVIEVPPAGQKAAATLAIAPRTSSKVSKEGRKDIILTLRPERTTHQGRDWEINDRQQV